MACIPSCFTCIFSVVTVLLCMCCYVVAVLDARDLAVLSDFKARIKNVDQLGWKDSQHPCSWKGIKCTGEFVSSISLANLRLQGTVSPNLNKLTSLTTIALQNNSFTGSLPSLNGLSKLQSCYMNDNQFVTIPWDFFSNLSSLRHMYIHNNPQLNQSSVVGGWSLTADLEASAFLTNLSLTNTSLVGRIPSFLGSMNSLSFLALAYNKLEGGIPMTFSFSSLQQFQANSQLGPRLSGDLSAVGNLVSLRLLWLHENEFSGVLPPNLANALSLTDLRLNNNRLVGPIPTSYSSLPLSIFAVENNQLDGSLPIIKGTCTFNNNLFCSDLMGVACAPQVRILLGFLGSFNYPSRLVSSWGGNNPCLSWIGIVCDSKGNVVIINLASSNLSGVINPNISQLASLTTLKLNDNHLVGTIPVTLVRLTSLRSLDVSNNNMTGPLPTFNDHVTVNIAGNPFVNITSATSSKPTGRIKVKRKSQLRDVIPIVFASLLVVFTAVFAVGYFMYKKGDADAKIIKKLPSYMHDSTKKTQATQGGIVKSIGFSEDINFALSLRTLIIATNNFSEEFYLGRGGFGSVYKGILDDGTIVAVKKMESAVMTSQGQKEFQSELDALTKLRHRHLVAILGYCIEGDERALVYEYMPGGTLSQHLFEWSQHGMLTLSWKTRLSIALDVARGLEYLHGLAQCKFIHRDLKPSNILLDENLRAKISDFGLMRLVPEGERQSVQTLVAGTFGYLAPEYAYTGHISTKGDVFSFGVMLMEILTGRPALDSSQMEGTGHLMTWFRRVVGKKDKVLEAIDSTMDIDHNDEETLKGISAISELAWHCTHKEASSRPDMGHAVNILAPLVKTWKPTDNVNDIRSEPHLTPEEVQRKLLSLNDLTITSTMSDMSTAVPASTLM
ncbi:hypothetical protein KP509_25G024600 [Ceratopteris richardii]|uniref:Protein kinase domain-containing protein n=1 Tax=Ceratopteris richardii TaxID=49495 RepID=A0A8T2RR93_CERRI|nr:hypothetical protein KP509_25G024600 [Ceratopteris richardii]KAH7298038.1 hypothetical protein KP509_25G024600 [Ceratopteris richardii]